MTLLHKYQKEKLKAFVFCTTYIKNSKLFYYDNQSIMRTQVDILEWTHFVNLIIN